MRVPLSWLAEFVELTEAVDVLAARLTMAGLAVEGIEEVGRLDGPVHVGRIETSQAHPAADRLRVCRVDVGAQGVRTIVSGAPDVRPGRLVAVASPGSRIGADVAVEVRELRGVRSEGMLCSEAELGLGDDADRLLALPPRSQPGTPLGDLAGVRDTVLEVDVTPDRGDCLSMLGIAREIAAVTGARRRRPRVRVREQGAPVAEGARLQIDAPDLCPLYRARVVRTVRARSSPLWMRLRLRRAGMRSISAVVDATNYVMLELGQPLHAFDLDRLAEATVVVRRARAGEPITTLDGAERRLTDEDLVIADASGAVAIAGVMGGERTEVRPETTALLLESAFFAPQTVRRTARRLGLVSQAAYRFERRVDPAGITPALDRLASLLAASTGGTIASGMLEAAPGRETHALPAVALRPARAAALLGMSLSVAEVRRRLRALGATCARDGRRLLVTPPTHRGDLRIEEDLVEEVARVGGYDTVPVSLPRVAVASARDSAARTGARRVRRLLVAEGLAETVSLPFVAPEQDDLVPGVVAGDLQPLGLRNPLSSETSRLRRSPLGGLLRTLRLNVDRGAEFVGVFELAKGYGLDGAGERQERRVIAALLWGQWPAQGAQRRGPATSFADLKGIAENLLSGVGAGPETVRWEPGSVPFLHPGMTAAVSLAGTAVGVLGSLHPNVVQVLDLPGEIVLMELDFQQVAHYRPARAGIRPLPRFPAVARDIAVVVDDSFLAQQILDEVRALNHPLIESARLFDCYRGDPVPAGRKSLAYAISYRAPDRTLTDDEVNEAHDVIRARLQARFGVALRS
jgi:phenylalanyl-tRNA synthetase beta chain